MAVLQVREVDDRLYNALKVRARMEKRSISQEVIKIIEEHLTAPQKKHENQTDAFLQLAGSWDDNRSSDEIVNEILSSRNMSQRFGEDNDLFD